MAERSGFDGVLIRETGVPAEGILWTVYDADNNEAVIYADKSSGAFKTNGVDPTDATGLIQFWVEPGYYEIEVDDTVGDLATRRIPFNAVAGDVDGIDSLQIDLSNMTDRITQDMLADNSVGTGQLKIWSDTATGLTTGSSAEATMVYVNYIPVGKYFVSATIGKASGPKSGFSFSSGSGTIDQGTPVAVTCTIEVTSTATLCYRGPTAAGNTNHVMSVWGFTK